ncbi:hypothetical protein NERG_00570 [Nematocida ausubeli]|uniref:Uncharacterized protein n=1 Tax=Nematocida ausubeli (strain ATCC PRA-371 / ERTm2) TaxID=1913371 RepID=H8ZAE9_NEMA1|nr:hypothetical protein NERG_00570 [Nematocida ausubeli]
MCSVYRVWTVAIVLEKIAAGVRDKALENFLYDVFISNKSLFTIVNGIIDETSLDNVPILSKELAKKTIFQLEFATVAAIILFLRGMMSIFVKKMPIVLYLTLFDYFDARYCRIANSQGWYDAVVFSMLFLLMIYCANCTLCEAVAFRERYLQSQVQIQ